MRTSSIFALSFLALAAVACGGSSSDDTSAPPADTADGSDEEVKAAVIGEESNGKTVSVVLGRSFTIALADNGASTGYAWKVTSVDKTLGYPKESSVPGDASKPGSPGTKKFTWSTKSPLDLVGKHQITIEKIRPWAETTPPAATFKVTIDILDTTTSVVCGGLRGATCTKGSYCDFPAKASCGMADQTGSCNPTPEFCPAVVMPVCGCDGKTYNNGCEANRAGVSVKSSGDCAK